MLFALKFMQCALLVQVLRAVALITTRLSEEPAYPKTIVRPFTYSNLTDGMAALTFGARTGSSLSARASLIPRGEAGELSVSRLAHQSHQLAITHHPPPGASPAFSLVAPGMLGLPQALGSPLTVGAHWPALLSGITLVSAAA